MCVLQFAKWQATEEQCERKFYAVRSVGHKKMINDKSCLKRVTSDANIDYYRNLSQIPTEIQQLVSDAKRKHENYYVHLRSPSGMVLYLQKLTKLYGENFYRLYFKLFDVLLLKFPSRKIPKMFSSKSYKKVLPTPLCFRDFNDYERMDSLQQQHTNGTTFCADGDGDKCRKANDYKPENFILETSIKHERQRTQQKLNGDVNEETTKLNSSENSSKESEKIHVYKACNKRVEYQVDESEFTTPQLSTKATLFKALNSSLEHLNFTCSLRDSVQLSYSHDLCKNNFKNVTLHDDASEMICSIDIDDNHNHNNNMIFSFPHGLRVKLIDANAIEVSSTETKRTYFSNGFVMTHQIVSGVVKIYSGNGTIYEITNEHAESNVKSNRELTMRHQFEIMAIKFVNADAFIMTLLCGDKFVVVNDSIVDIRLEVDALRVHEWRDERTGNLHTHRSDGLGLLKYASMENAQMKCAHYDGTIITTLYNGEDIVTIKIDDDEKPTISILDEIWLSEAEKHSKFAINDVLDCVSSDYYLNVNQSCQFEHKLCGVFKFDRGVIEMKLFNGATIRKHNEDCSISLRNGITLRLNEKQMQFYDGKCGECFR